MPIERQSRAPLTRRDKQLIVALCTAFLAAAAAIAAVATTEGPRHDAGCIELTLPSTMGGATIRRCAAGARSFCRQQHSIPEIAAACRRHGFPIAP